MFIITKTFTDDEGHLFTKVNPKQYSTPGEAYDAMREDLSLTRSLVHVLFTISLKSGLLVIQEARFLY